MDKVQAALLTRLEASLGGPANGRWKVWPIIRRGAVTGPTIDKVIESEHEPFAAIGNERDVLLISRFKADSSIGRNIETHSESGGAVEIQIAIGLEEMEMRSHLDRPVTGIADFQGRPRPSGIDLDR